VGAPGLLPRLLPCGTGGLPLPRGRPARGCHVPARSGAPAAATYPESARFRSVAHSHACPIRSVSVVVSERGTGSSMEACRARVSVRSSAPRWSDLDNEPLETCARASGPLPSWGMGNEPVAQRTASSGPFPRSPGAARGGQVPAEPHAPGSPRATHATTVLAGRADAQAPTRGAAAPASSPLAACGEPTGHPETGRVLRINP
jgi:hypothetical protein